MLQTRENFIRSQLVEKTQDARVAFASWDYEGVLSAAKSLVNIADAMRKHGAPADALSAISDFPLNDTPTDQGNGGHKVKSDVPDPTMPPSGGVAEPIAATDGASTLRSMR